MKNLKEQLWISKEFKEIKDTAQWTYGEKEEANDIQQNINTG